jgi:hypothetical protein
LSLFLGLPVCRRSSLLARNEEGVREEPNYTTERKPGPLKLLNTICPGAFSFDAILALKGITKTRHEHK